MANPCLSYPFPSNVHVMSSVPLKLNDSNYLLWKTQFEFLLSSQQLLGFVNGSVTPPPVTRTVTHDNTQTEESNPLYESWFCTDQLVRSWIFGTLFEEVLGSVHTLSTSHDVWLHLAESYYKSSLSREFSLRHSLHLLTKNDKSLATYCREFRRICDALSAIGKPVDESLKIFGFFNGLTRDYDPITTVIQSSLNKLSPPSFNDVVSEVEGFDTKLQSYKESNTAVSNIAIQAQQTNEVHYVGNQRGRGRLGNNRGRGGYTTRGRGFSQHQTTQNTSGSRPTCQICRRISYTALKCYNRFDNTYQSPYAQSFAALQVAYPVEESRLQTQVPQLM
ncbi:PREDICTED: uncharacterized protein LOC104743891 [Camelina sativa]|uniref:Uncharacterized protein LOC104743891 n=1 Tax=Camelina sativa TaxID=90675 RepID=A0ABM0VYS9_CAMSA|nr:PREDICTED: uncharacterized protein LOC104743891 [Camelina sativa]